MAELRHNDGTIRWRGEDPADALAATFELGEKAGEHSLHGLDSTDLPTPNEGESDEDFRTRIEARNVTLISEKPQTVYRVVNEATGEVVATAEKKSAAEAEVRRLHNLEEHTPPEDVAPNFRASTPLHEGRVVRFHVEQG